MALHFQEALTSAKANSILLRFITHQTPKAWELKFFNQVSAQQFFSTKSTHN